jgi:YD repeat-containing protein
MQNKRRLLLCIACILLAAALLAGCGKTGGDSPTQSEAAAGAQAGSTNDASATPSSDLDVSLTGDDAIPGTEAPTAVPQNSSTLPNGTTPASTTKKSATAGAAADVLAYVKQVQDTLNSKNFTLKGSASSSPLVLVASGDKVAFEAPTSWLMSQLAATDAGLSTAEAASMTTLLGKTLRLVATPERTLLVMPDLRAYSDLGDVGVGDVSTEDFEELFNYLGGKDALKNIKTSTATLNGKEHQVATIKDEDGKDLARLYFLQGQLKRIELLQGDLKTTLDVTSLQNTADASYFSTKGLYPFDFSALQGMGGLGGMTLPNLR